MIPSESDLMFCVMVDGGIADGQGGLAIGPTEADAWTRFNGGEDWAVKRSIECGAVVRRCAIQVINPQVVTLRSES